MHPSFPQTASAALQQLWHLSSYGQLQNRPQIGLPVKFDWAVRSQGQGAVKGAAT